MFLEVSSRFISNVLSKFSFVDFDRWATFHQEILDLSLSIFFCGSSRLISNVFSELILTISSCSIYMLKKFNAFNFHSIICILQTPVWWGFMFNTLMNIYQCKQKEPSSQALILSTPSKTPTSSQSLNGYFLNEHKKWGFKMNAKKWSL